VSTAAEQQGVIGAVLASGEPDGQPVDDSEPNLDAMTAVTASGWEISHDVLSFLPGVIAEPDRHDQVSASLSSLPRANAARLRQCTGQLARVWPAVG
jgi:hypothetical protein